MTDDDKIRRSRAWKALYEEEGGIRDMMTKLREDRLNAMSEALPWEIAKLANLKIAADIATKFDQMVQRVIDDGKIAKHSEQFLTDVSGIPNFPGRWAA